MPRKARIDAPGALHHIICRGIERGLIFQDNTDRDDFIKRLSAILSDTSIRLRRIMPGRLFQIPPASPERKARDGGQAFSSFTANRYRAYSYRYAPVAHRLCN